MPTNGGTAAASVTNTRKLGSLEVTKAVNWNGITPEADSFEICITGPSYATPNCQSITTADVSEGKKALWNNLIPGGYTVTETAQPEWTTAVPPAAVAVPGNGGTAAASVTNTRKLGSVEVTKVVNWNGVTPETDSFQICISGPSYATPNCQSITTADVSEGKKALWNNLIPGSYSVTETAQPEWTTAVPSAPVTVPANGGTAAASVTNTRKLGGLEVTKTVNWNGITAVESQIFEICIKGSSYPLGSEPGACQSAGYNGGKLTWINLAPGSYTVIETNPGNMWTVQVAGSPANVPIDGGSVSASVTNTRKNGGLQITKTVNWNGITPVETQTFEICISGPTYPDGDCKTTDYDGDTLIWGSLVPGDYTVTETDPGSEWTVVIDASPVTIPVDGTTASASVTNTRKLGSLEITKQVNWNGVTPVEGTTFTICIQGPSYPATPNCKIFTYPTNLTQTWTDLIPGDYTVTEPATGGPGAAPQERPGATPRGHHLSRLCCPRARWPGPRSQKRSAAPRLGLAGER